MVTVALTMHAWVADVSVASPSPHFTEASAAYGYDASTESLKTIEQLGV